MDLSISFGSSSVVLDRRAFTGNYYCDCISAASCV